MQKYLKCLLLIFGSLPPMQTSANAAPDNNASSMRVCAGGDSAMRTTRSQLAQVLGEQKLIVPPSGDVKPGEAALGEKPRPGLEAGQGLPMPGGDSKAGLTLDRGERLQIQVDCCRPGNMTCCLATK